MTRPWPSRSPRCASRPAAPGWSTWSPGPNPSGWPSCSSWARPCSRPSRRWTGTTLRRLSRDRRTMIDSLARRAGELGRDQGYPATGRRAIQEVSQTPAGGAGRPGDRRAGPGRPAAPGPGLRRVRPGRPGLGPGRLDAGEEEGNAPLKAVPDLEPDEAEDEPRTTPRRARPPRQARAEADAARTAAEEAETGRRRGDHPGRRAGRPGRGAAPPAAGDRDRRARGAG